MSSEEKTKKIEKIIQHVDQSDISSIKSVVSGIVKIINDTSSTAKDLVDLILIDPPLTAKVLKIANSAYYSPRQKIFDIEESIIWIGFDALKELALNQKVCEIFQAEAHIEDYSRAALWKHSIAVALLGKMIFRKEFGERGENIYVAGLLHDIGIIALDQFLPIEFEQILLKSKNENKNIQISENEILGYDHTDIGQAITEHWNFPTQLIRSIQYHGNPIHVFQEYLKMTYTLYIADCLCQESGIGFCSTFIKNRKLFHTCLQKLDVKPNALKLIIAELKQEIKKMEDQGIFN